MLQHRKIYSFYRTISNATRKKVDISKNLILEKEQIEEAIKLTPTLSSTALELWHRAHETFLNHGLNTNDFLQVVTFNPSILSRNPNKITESLEIWRSCQFGEKHMYQLIVRYPSLLDFDDSRKLLERTTYLRSYVGSIKNVWRLLMNSPTLVKDNLKSIEEKFDYLTGVMRIEIPEIVKSEVFSRSLEDIKCRHVFLERLGIFKPRSLKAMPHEPSKNARLYQIMDTSDKVFATKVAGVTLPEFEAFQELFKRELYNQDDDDDDDEDEFSDDTSTYN